MWVAKRVGDERKTHSNPNEAKNFPPDPGTNLLSGVVILRKQTMTTKKGKETGLLATILDQLLLSVAIFLQFYNVTFNFQPTLRVHSATKYKSNCKK